MRNQLVVIIESMQRKRSKGPQKQFQNVQRDIPISKVVPQVLFIESHMKTVFQEKATSNILGEDLTGWQYIV